MIELAVNKALKIAYNSQELLQPLVAKRLLVVCTDLPEHNYLATFDLDYVTIERIPLANVATTTFATKIAGPVSGFITMAKNPNTNLHKAKLQVSGDLTTAENIQALFQNIDVDWEEELAKYTGDALGYKIAAGIKSVHAYGKSVGNDLLEMISEYLKTETAMLPSAVEVDKFTSEVDELHAAVARLEAKVKYFESS